MKTECKGREFWHCRHENLVTFGRTREVATNRMICHIQSTYRYLPVTKPGSALPKKLNSAAM